jgi:hypothetical protein
MDGVLWDIVLEQVKLRRMAQRLILKTVLYKTRGPQWLLWANG